MPPRRTSGRNHRATKACARCRQRKTKCDFVFPACGACVKAGVTCMGFDAATDKEQPRSLVTYLENKVARLEVDLSRLTGNGTFASHHGHGLGRQNREIRAELARGIALSRRPNVKIQKPHRPSAPLQLATYLSPSIKPRLHPLPTSILNDHLPSPQHQSIEIAAIPRQAVNIMLQNYTDIYLAQYPVLEEPQLYDACDRIYAGIATSFDFYVVAMALAISAHTLIRYDEERATKSAGEFWATAVLHFDLIMDGDHIDKLHALMLLCHYSLVDPSNVNALVCSGAVMRLCVEMGLHREQPDHVAESAIFDANTKRRLFWTAYALASQIFTRVGLPFDLSSGAISTRYPDEHQDGRFGPDKIATANYMYAWRRFEVDITKMTLHPSRATDVNLEGRTEREWLEAAQHRVEEWRLATESREIADKVQFRDIMCQLATIRLNRVSPQSPHPDLTMRRKSIFACMAMVREYATSLRLGNLFYIFHAYWHLFEVTVVLLEAIHTGLDLIIQRQESWLGLSDSVAIMRTMKTIPYVLRGIATRWPQIQQAVKDLEATIDPALRKVQEWMDGSIISKADAQELKVLRRFLRGYDDQPAEDDGSLAGSLCIPLPPTLTHLAYKENATAGPSGQEPIHPLDNSAEQMVTGPGIDSTAIVGMDSMFAPSQPLRANISGNLDFDISSFTIDATTANDKYMFLGNTGMDLNDIFTAFSEGRGF